MNMKRIAFLVLAHKNIEQVDRLIRKIKHNNCTTFVHCDKRWEEGFAFFSVNENCVCCNNRFEANLDEWSLVEAELELLRTAREYGEYQYYVLLSGQDYPIVALEKMISELASSYPKPFIDCTPWGDNNWVQKKFCSNYNFLKCSRRINKYTQTPYFRKILKVIPYLMNKIIDIFSTPRKRLLKLNIELYGGSAWWILPDVIVDYILNEVEKSPKYISELCHTITPEETFFQIMAMNSPYREMVELNPKDMVLQNCKTYAYFRGKNKPFTGHPYIFTAVEEDLSLLREKRKNFFFARKFDVSVNSDILDILDDETE